MYLAIGHCLSGLGFLPLLEWTLALAICHCLSGLGFYHSSGLVHQIKVDVLSFALLYFTTGMVHQIDKGGTRSIISGNPISFGTEVNMAVLLEECYIRHTEVNMAVFLRSVSGVPICFLGTEVNTAVASLISRSS